MVGRHTTACRWFGWLVVVGCVAGSAAAWGAEPGQPAASDKATAQQVRPAAPVPAKPPAWAHDARWYELVVPRFRDGEPGNNPAGAAAWSAQPAADGVAMPAYGGDLQGVAAKLGELKSWGVNALLISPVFCAPPPLQYDVSNLRHIEPTLAAAGAVPAASETLDPKTWSLTAADRVWIDLVTKAHAEGLRVVVDLPITAFGAEHWAWQDVVQRGKASPYAEWFAFEPASPPVPLPAQLQPGEPGRLITLHSRPKAGLDQSLHKHLLAITSRWLDPNGDGQCNDGVDGFRITAPDRLSRSFWVSWRAHVKQLNPNALLIAQSMRDPEPWLGGDVFDAVVQPEVGQCITRFFSGADSSYTQQRFLDELTRLRQRSTHDQTLAALHPLGGEGGSRWLTAIAPSASELTEDHLARARLAAVFQHFCAGAPVTYFGDEVGMRAGGAKDALPGLRPAPQPRWWSDLAEPQTKSPDYRGDLVGLIRMLHEVRQVHAPLREGTFHATLLDDEHQVLAVARRAADAEAVLILNYGREPQRVSVPFGQPGDVVFLLTPQLVDPKQRGAAPSQPARASASPRVPLLQHGRARQVVSADGQITVVVKPMAVRLGLLRAEDEN